MVDSIRSNAINFCIGPAGTGKTYTSLKIAEEMAGAGKSVLFLVPSLNLLSQTLTEWTQFSDTPITSFAVCSDGDVGKKQKGDDRNMLIHELEYPATTDAKKLAKAVEQTKIETRIIKWALSSVGRASPLQGEGQWFEPTSAHHIKKGLKPTRLQAFFISKIRK
mgnify:CR=1 FL=1